LTHPKFIVEERNRNAAAAHDPRGGKRSKAWPQCTARDGYTTMVMMMMHGMN
jgi:hypothetical protein